VTRQYYEFFCPVKLIVGNRALDNIPFELGALGASRPMIVTDRGVAGAGLVDRLRDVLSIGGLQVAAIFDEVPPDSSVVAVRAIARRYREAACDSLIALGGGSPIDTAKAANILASEDTDDLIGFSGVGNLPRPLKPLVVIPTTAGTGSEVTYVSVIRDEARGVKVAFASPFLMPDAAVLDPRMTLSLPPQITAATAMDALTHAIEAYTCLAKNPMSDAYAFAAVRAIATHLLPVLDRPGDEDGRLELAQAAAMAGIAFSNSMVGLVHALGHATGALCHIHHGTCMSVLLPAVLDYNMDARRAAIGERRHGPRPRRRRARRKPSAAYDACATRSTPAAACRVRSRRRARCNGSSCRSSRTWRSTTDRSSSIRWRSTATRRLQSSKAPGTSLFAGGATGAAAGIPGACRGHCRPTHGYRPSAATSAC
jgi:alcohol dehydrogenase